MKHKFIETFTDIDDKYIADAKPVAEKPIELRPEARRPTAAWKKITAAAACLAVLGGGSALAVKVMNSENTPAVSGSSDSPGASISSGSNSTVMNNDSREPWYANFDIVNSANYDGVKASIGIEKMKFGRGAIVKGLLVIENTTDKPVKLASDRVAINIEGLKSYDTEITFDTTIQPGKFYYQIIALDTCTQEFTNDFQRDTGYKTALLAAAGRYNGTAVISLLSDADDQTSEVIGHTMDFSVDIEDWNAADTFSSIYPNSVDEWLNTNGPEIFTIRDDFPDVKFECDGRSISRIDADGSKIRLFGGEYINGYMVCDINNDGYGDILATVSFEFTDDGKLPERECVFAYDCANDQIYAIADFENQHFSVFIGEGNGSRRMANRAMLNTMLSEKHDIISWEPLTFDMLRPCVLKENGEPLFLSSILNDADRFGDIGELETGKSFIYQGKSYVVIAHPSERFPWDFDTTSGHDLVIGARRETINGIDTVEFAIIFANLNSEGLLINNPNASADEPFIINFELNGSYNDDVFVYPALRLEPGEVCCQIVSYPITATGEYMFSVDCVFDLNGRLGAVFKANFNDESQSMNDIFTIDKLFVDRLT